MSKSIGMKGEKLSLIFCFSSKLMPQHLRRRLLWISLVLVAVIGSIFLWINIIFKLVPEVASLAHSQCKDPLQTWNGKILSFQVWRNAFLRREPHENVYRNTEEFGYDRRRLTHSSSIISEAGHGAEHPVIIWGSHHKTGTYLAQKIFFSLCSRMHWCCIFHVTRDSIHAVKQVLKTEAVHVLGHSQWIWFPEELGVSYRFVHFYRHPYRKIASGYKYHRAGTEAWTNQVKHYPELCTSRLRRCSKQWAGAYTSQRNSSLSLLEGDSGGKLSDNYRKDAASQSSHHSHSLVKRRRGRKLVSRALVVEHCRAVHMCETCCRREHEVDYGADISDGLTASTVLPSSSSSSSTSGSSSAGLAADSKSSKNWGGGGGRGLVQTSSEDAHSPQIILGKNRTRYYGVRDENEYTFLCKNLGQTVSNISLREAFSHTLSLEKGLLAQAALDFYESMRMARIVNHTWDDPRTLNVDLDALTDNFSSNIRSILRHLDLELSLSEVEAIAAELSFYDLKTSPLYRFSMTHVFHHVSGQARRRLEETDTYEKILQRNPEVKRVFTGVFALLAGTGLTPDNG